MNGMISRLRAFFVTTWHKNKILVKPCLVMFLIYLVGVSAIILANVHFADDVARTNFGYSGWTGFSRYTTTILAYGMHADGYLTNIAPLPQLIAIAILAVSSVLMIYAVVGKSVFLGSAKKWIWYLIAVIPLGLSPYMLECLAYQYDAPYMALSILFAVIPLLFSKSRRWIFALAIFVGVIVICTTYQAAVGILPMLIVVVAVKKWNENKNTRKLENLKFVLFSAVVFVVSLLVFQKILMKPRDSYASNSLPEFQDLLNVFWGHLQEYFSHVIGDFKVLWLVLIAMVCVGFVVVFVMRSRRKKMVALFAGIAVVVFVGVMSFAFYAVLDKPLFATRAMYPFGVAIALLAIFAVTGGGVITYVMRIPTAILSWCFLVFALTFGNALKEQDIYRSDMQNMVISDLNEMQIMQDDHAKYIQVTGNLGYSPVIWHMPQEYKILDRLLMPTYSEYAPWMATKITEQSGFRNLFYNESVDLRDRDLPLLKETYFYDIRGDDEGILVLFKDPRRFDASY